MKVKLTQPDFTSDYGKNLLRARGIEDVDKFVNPDESCLQDWRDLDNIEKGVDIITTLKENARIGLIVDCDCDGFTSSAIIYQYLKRINPHFEITYYVHDGKAHGLEEHWEAIKDELFDLVLVPDAGSNDGEYAAELECPVLVIDHHLVEEPIFPPNMTVINNQLSPNYKNKNLSGAGVTYQFCRALDAKLGHDWASDFIDLAALGIDGDMMSALEYENQYFWRKGFSNVKNYFFVCLMRKQVYSLTSQTSATDERLMKSLNPISVGFYIAPLINAMTRAGTLEEKTHMFEAFIDGHKKIPSGKRGAKGALEEVAIEAVRECNNAKAHQNKIKEEVTAKLEQKIFKHDLLENQILFVRLDDDDDFPSELNGLIANQLASTYHHPTIVARLNDQGYIRGSLRAPSNSELPSFKDYLDSTGLCEYVLGHDSAAGVSILNRNLPKLHELANKDLLKYDFGNEYYEADFKRQALRDDLKNIIFDLENYRQCWGQQCPEPFIYITDLNVSSNDIQIIGKNKDTVKIVKNGITYIKFTAKDMIEDLKQYSKMKLEVVGVTNVNEWNGTITPQIQIKAYDVKEDKLFDF